MKRIRLDVDELEVHSFTTAAAGEHRGTVRGREMETYFGTSCGPGCQYTAYQQYSCLQACFQQTHEFETCYETGRTCGASCDWGCDTVYVCPPGGSSSGPC